MDYIENNDINHVGYIICSSKDIEKCTKVMSNPLIFHQIKDFIQLVTIKNPLVGISIKILQPTTWKNESINDEELQTAFKTLTAMESTLTSDNFSGWAIPMAIVSNRLFTILKKNEKK
jgi:hypothetical protein